MDIQQRWVYIDQSKGFDTFRGGNTIYQEQGKEGLLWISLTSFAQAVLLMQKEARTKFEISDGKETTLQP